MAILESCCCWKTVRKGSVASGFYTLTYFSISSLMLLFYIHEEKEFLFGTAVQPIGESIIEKGDLTTATVIFNVLFLACSLLMIFSSVLLLLGLRENKRQFLTPWMFFMLCDLLIELAHLIHLSLARRVVFDPIVGFIFTIDFFVLCLNLYCLLCVISQYQEYMTQRSSIDRQTVSPIVTFTTPQKLEKTCENPTRQKSHRLLSTSPLVNSQRLTNFSTISEAPEEEQQGNQQLQQSDGDRN